MNVGVMKAVVGNGYKDKLVIAYSEDKTTEQARSQLESDSGYDWKTYWEASYESGYWESMKEQIIVMCVHKMRPVSGFKGFGLIDVDTEKLETFMLLSIINFVDTEVKFYDKPTRQQRLEELTGSDVKQFTSTFMSYAKNLSYSREG